MNFRSEKNSKAYEITDHGRPVQQKTNGVIGIYLRPDVKFQQGQGEHLNKRNENKTACGRTNDRKHGFHNRFFLKFGKELCDDHDYKKRRKNYLKELIA